jgi:hypothetical protein
MGQFAAVVLGTPRSTSRAARGLLLGSLASCAMAVAALSSAGIAEATCINRNSAGPGTGCPNTYIPVRPQQQLSAEPQQQLSAGPQQQLSAGPQQQPVSVGPPPSSTDAIAVGDIETVGDIQTTSAVSNPVTVADSMVGTDEFGPYGCEDFVDAAYGRTTATGIGHDAALAFYQSLADRGLVHHEMPIPPGALVFSMGGDGGHVDISRGDGTYVSGGVQGLSPGYGDGHNVQILPTPNLGSWTLEGWAYPPW